MILESSYQVEVREMVKGLDAELFLTDIVKERYDGSKEKFLEHNDAIDTIAALAQKNLEEYGYGLSEAVKTELYEYLGIPEEEKSEYETAENVIAFAVNNQQSLVMTQNAYDGEVKAASGSGWGKEFKPDNEFVVSAGDMIMLLNWYRYVKDGDIANDFINPNGKNPPEKK